VNDAMAESTNNQMNLQVINGASGFYSAFIILGRVKWIETPRLVL
jgi:hypothetical protein